MPTYEILYTREQRYYMTIVAPNEDEAQKLAWKEVELLDLSSEDDESDDSGELWIEEQQ